MKDALEVLREKEAALARVRKEVESLQLIAPMLEDNASPPQSVHQDGNDPGEELHSSSEATGTDGLFSSSTPTRSRFWSVLTGKTS